MSDQYNLARICEKVTRVIAKRWGVACELGSPEVLKDSVRNLVLRLPVSSAGQVPTSLIVKKILKTPTCGYTDWASLEYLERLGIIKGVPTFYVGDLEEGLFIMEDLGEHPTLDDLLQATNRQRVEAAFRALALTTAQLHAQTILGQGEYEKLRHALPECGEPIRYQQAKSWSEGLQRVEGWFSAVERETGAKIKRGIGFGEALETINQLYREPGTLMSFTHGDMAPTNNLVLPNGEVYLLDFEYGGERHPLYDLTAWNVLCPLPANLVEMINNEYWKELVAQSPIPLDEELFHRDYAYISAWRALAMLSWIPVDILQEDRPWVEAWTMRQAVLAALHRLNRSCAGQGELRALVAGTQILAEQLEKYWGPYETILPQWPALEE